MARSFEIDTPLVERIREHLLRLARSSFSPVHGGRRAAHESPEEDAVMVRFRPFAELFVLVAAADGKIVDQERAMILGAFRALTGGRVSGATLTVVEAEIQERLAGTEPDSLLEEVCARLASSRMDAELALTLASAVASADHEVDPAELELIQKLAAWLSIGPERARVVLTGV